MFRAKAELVNLKGRYAVKPALTCPYHLMLFHQHHFLSFHVGSGLDAVQIDTRGYLLSGAVPAVPGHLIIPGLLMSVYVSVGIYRNSEALRYLAMSLENTMRVNYSQFIPENRRHLFYAQF